jgi:magnesium transporter
MKKHSKNSSKAEQVKELLALQNIEKIKQVLSLLHIPVIVDILNQSTQAEKTTLIKLLPKNHAARVFRRLDTKHKKELLKGLSKPEVSSLLATLRPDERVNLFEKMPSHISKQLLEMLEPEDLAKTKKLLSYPKNSVGRLMTPEFVAAQKDWTIEEVLSHIRERAKDSETIDVVYIVDNGWKLLGKINLSEIVLASPNDKVSNHINKDVVSLNAKQDREKAVNLMNNYRLSVIPVIDKDKDLIGIVTFDDVVEVAQQEATEDIHRISAIAPMDVSYNNASIWKLFHKRVGWLLALVFVSLVSSGVIAAFEETLSSAIALTFFIPLLIGSGGNAGAQSATLMIRAVSLGEIKPKDWFKTAGKEMVVGASLAVALGIFSSMMGFFRGGVEIGLIVGLSMATIIIATNLLGALLPFALVKLKIDPAVASGPLVSSVSDIIGLTIYFSIASVILTSIS